MPPDKQGDLGCTDFDESLIFATKQKENKKSKIMRRKIKKKNTKQKG
jgi:hypothetical protein